MNNPTEDEKKAIALARRRERARERKQDPAYYLTYLERKREQERKRGHDPVYRERKRKRWRDRRQDPAYREREREQQRDLRYGLAPGQWDAEFDRLRGVCPIDRKVMLRKAPAGRRPNNLAVTDHDHGTNRFRGIICNECNKNLTKTWCKRWVLRAAEAYLAKAGQDPDAPVTQGTLL